MNSAKKLFLLALVAFSIVLSGCSLQQDSSPKYVFYFIGDGMGVQHITATQAYLAHQQKTEGNVELSFTDFPTVGLAETYSQNRYITGSAAAGTALATGHKTSVNTIGLNYNHTDSLFSIAHFAQKSGYKVGVATTVSIDHATPAAFYAHQQSRNMYHEIGHDLVSASYDFYAGGGFKDPVGDESKAPRGDVFLRADSLGFVFTNQFKIPEKLNSNQKSIVYTHPKPASGASFKYHIDNKPDDPSLAQAVKLGIDVLTNPNGFLYVIEGGKIDWAAHDNDAATVVHEVISLSDAVSVALDFYQKHPNETLIVVTADHETGGFSVGNAANKYETNISLLSNQKLSLEELDKQVSLFKKENKGKPTFEQVISYLESTDVMGLDYSTLSDDHKEYLKSAYQASIAIKSDNQVKLNEKLYGWADPIAVASVRVLNNIAGVGWTSFSHTASHVPIYAIGASHERFSGQIDNTDIPKLIAEAMGIEFN